MEELDVIVIPDARVANLVYRRQLILITILSCIIGVGFIFLGLLGTLIDNNFDVISRLVVISCGLILIVIPIFSLIFAISERCQRWWRLDAQREVTVRNQEYNQHVTGIITEMKSASE